MKTQEGDPRIGVNFIHIRTTATFWNLEISMILGVTNGYDHRANNIDSLYRFSNSRMGWKHCIVPRYELMRIKRSVLSPIRTNGVRSCSSVDFVHNII